MPGGRPVTVAQTGGKHRPGTVLPIRPEVMAQIMNDPAAAGLPARAPFTPADCGYAGAYRLGSETVPHCPGCGRQQWQVGRVTAECAFCSTALPLIGC